ncbi:DUF4192 family protein [Kineococcus sp. SYSU DK001]|uniref:DUF4192 family protein n=1 Tax=Kineococcus sp. SYSU DK001 TaxID=3383122 RepID=UPI003D7D4523
MTSPHEPPTATSLRAHGPQELVALVPYCLGFHPADSLVALEFGTPGPGGGRPLSGGLRVDLPVSPAPGDVAAATGPLLAVLRRDVRPGSQVHLLVLDPDARLREGVLTPGDRAAATVRHVLADLGGGPAGPAPAEVLLVTADRWRSLTCHRPCCPPGGAPRDGAGAGRVTAEAVGRGLAPAADRAGVLPPTAPHGPERLAAAAAARRRARRAPAGPALVAAFDAAVEARLGSRVAQVPDAAWCGRVLAGLADTGVRDAVLLSGARGPVTERARAAVLHPGRAPGAAGGDAVDLIDRALAEELDPVRASAAAAVAVDVARHAVDRSAAGAWAVAAWLHWQCGASAPAGGCAQRALELDPSHRLAGLVGQAVRLGLRPSR